MQASKFCKEKSPVVKKATRHRIQALAFLVLDAASLVLNAACSRRPPPGAAIPLESPAADESAALSPSGVTSTEPLAEKDAALLKALEKSSSVNAQPGNGNGAWLGIFGPQAQVYSAPSLNKENRIGYIRRGGEVAVQPLPLRSGDGCSEGWYQLIPVGYVCGKYATLDLNHPQVRLGVTAPNLEGILPYMYARNMVNGTPLYKGVPSREEMAAYESPERAASDVVSRRRQERTASIERKKKKGRSPGRRGDEVDRNKDTAVDDTAEFSASPFGGGFSPAVSSTMDGPDADRNKPWWARSYENGKPDIKLSDLVEDADSLLAKRMVSGFYVAVDRSFTMNGRSWYKTTNGLVVPSDRFSVVKPPALMGQEIDPSHAEQAVGFVLVKSGSKYEIDADRGTLKGVGTIERYDRAFLTGRTVAITSKLYRETIDGWWMRATDGTITEPGPAPKDLAPQEKWIDVNLSRQTLVAFEGTRPMFATLLSSGRKGADKEHDHTTPKGTWRIREKHVAATMDGDGAVAGDQPYSIEDVPYILYFFESYALHGAFWHDNFGRQQSHGCLNLAPLDAKRLFLWSDPPMPMGWHGMVSSAALPGSRVVVHD